MKVKNILVPIDFSDISHFAADYALFLAEQYHDAENDIICQDNQSAVLSEKQSEKCR